jgi:hypothetical protein
METTFVYSESARRKAQKKKALEEGEAEQKKLAHLAQPSAKDQPWEHRPPHPPGKDTRRAGQPERVARPAPAAPGAVKAVVRVIRKKAAAQPAPGAVAQAARPRAAAPARAAAQRAAAARPAASKPAMAGAARPGSSRTLPAPELKASEERLLLESQELDLYGKGAPAKVCVCPDCHHELVRVVCLGTPVRACLECKGVWLPLPVVRDFARENEWFAQLGAAMQAIAKPTAGT